MSTAEFPFSLFSSASSFIPGECQVSLKSPPSSPPPPFSRMRTSTHDLYHHLLLFLPRPGKGESVQKFLTSGPCAHCRNSSSPYSAGHNFQSTLARLWQFRQAWASCTARTVTGCGARKPQQLWHAFSQKFFGRTRRRSFLFAVSTPPRALYIKPVGLGPHLLGESSIKA